MPDNVEGHISRFMQKFSLLMLLYLGKRVTNDVYIFGGSLWVSSNWVDGKKPAAISKKWYETLRKVWNAQYIPLSKRFEDFTDTDLSFMGSYSTFEVFFRVLQSEHIIPFGVKVFEDFRVSLIDFGKVINNLQLWILSAFNNQSLSS